MRGVGMRAETAGGKGATPRQWPPERIRSGDRRNAPARRRATMRADEGTQTRPPPKRGHSPEARPAPERTRNPRRPARYRRCRCSEPIWKGRPLPPGSTTTPRPNRTPPSPRNEFKRSADRLVRPLIASFVPENCDARCSTTWRLKSVHHERKKIRHPTGKRGQRQKRRL